MDLTNENKRIIDSQTYEQLKHKWCTAPIGEPWFKGPTGRYWLKRIDTLEALQPTGADHAGSPMSDDFDKLRDSDGHVNLDTIREEITLHHSERWWESVCRTLFAAYDALNREIEQATAEARKYLSCPDPTLYDLCDAIAQLAQVKITSLDNCKTLECKLAAIDMGLSQVEQQLAVAQKRIDQQAATITRLRALVEKAIEVFKSEELKSLTVIGHMHGCPYAGPVFPTDEAIAALEER